MTDSGGGGTLESLGRELQKLGICSEDFLIMSCSLHNLQTCLRTGVVTHLGEGGKDSKDTWKRNMMQLLHGIWNFQTDKYHEPEELKRKWQKVCEMKGINKNSERCLSQYSPVGGL